MTARVRYAAGFLLVTVVGLLTGVMMGGAPRWRSLGAFLLGLSVMVIGGMVVAMYRHVCEEIDKLKAQITRPVSTIYQSERSTEL